MSEKLKNIKLVALFGSKIVPFGFRVRGPEMTVQLQMQWHQTTCIQDELLLYCS